MDKHLYDDADWIELTPALRKTLATDSQKVDVRQRNEIIAVNRKAQDIDWTPNPLSPYSVVAYRPAKSR